MDKKKAAERAARIQKDEAIVNKLLMAVTMAVLSVIGLMIAYRLLTRADTLLATHAALGVLTPVLAAAGIACVLCAVYAYRQKARKERLAARLAGVAAITLIIAVCCALMRFFGRDVIAVLYALLPGIAALYLVFYLYQREFFCITVLTCAGGISLWVLSRLLGGSALGYMALPFGAAALVMLALAFVFLLLVRAKSGLLSLKGKSVRLFPHGTRYELVFLTCGLVALALAGALIFGALFAYYAIFAIFGFLFIMAVYYTVKLM